MEFCQFDYVLVYFHVSRAPLTLIGMTYESVKNAHLHSNLGASFIRLNELGRVSNYPD